MLKRTFKNCLLLSLIFWSNTMYGDTIFVKATRMDDTRNIQDAINQAKKRNGKPVVIKLEQDNYALKRESSSKNIYYVSNTASANENPDPTKHIGLWLKGLKNITIDGGGALLVTYGEMTSFVVDRCENVILKNFAVTSDDPTVVEMTVVEAGTGYLVVKPHASARYKIENGKISWLGHGWTLNGGIAQLYDPELNVSTRCTSPMSNLKSVQQLSDGLIRFTYEKAPHAKPGQIFQMRDGIRDEVAGFIVNSKNVMLENIRMHFLGNFSIVGQYTENITYNHLYCEPEMGSGRSCAGFADFVHFSGCKGKITITNSRFEGAQDDPINVHGTHLSVQEYVGEKQIKVRFMHPQSYGFEAFFKGDEIELVNANSLICVQKAKVAAVNRISDFEILLTLNKKVEPQVRKISKVVVENVTWTPEVEISDCYFARIPTRGILVSTRRKVMIENNVFFRMPMSGILIANDARSWYESGNVRDVTIRNNNFIECGAPVIYITPENDENEGFVHKNIRIMSNRFLLNDENAIYAKSVSGLLVQDNLFISDGADDPKKYIQTEECEHVTIKDNRTSKKSVK